MQIKPQDVLFIAVLITLLFKRDSKLFVFAGLILLGLAIPLFYNWVFFTAQRFMIYAFILIAFATLLQIFKLRANQSKND